MPPGPGRPKGSKNKKTQAALEFAERMLDKEWEKAAKERMLNGKAPHLETLLLQFKHGKPKETMDIHVSHDLSELLQVALQRRKELTEGEVEAEVSDVALPEANENDQG